MSCSKDLGVVDAGFQFPKKVIGIEHEASHGSAVGVYVLRFNRIAG